MDVVGYDMAKRCADDVFAKAGFRPGEGRDQVSVVELHDCFAANEVGSFPTQDFYSLTSDVKLITYAALGLCKEEDACRMVDAGDNTVSTPDSRS